MDKTTPRLAFAWSPYLVQSQIVGMLIVVQFVLDPWTDVKPDMPSLDKGALFFLLFAGINLAVVLAGDRWFRAKGWWRRPAYMALGAGASSVAHVVALAPAAYVQAASDGNLVALLGFPLLIGAAAAFLMHKSLGISAEGDDPVALAKNAKAKGEGGAVLDIGTAEYYDGPLQVRTSAMAGIIAALAGGAMFTFIQLVGIGDGFLPAEATPPLFRNNPVLFALYGILGCAALFYVFIQRSHGFLQRRGKSEMRSYILAGVFVPAGFALAFIALMGPFGFIFVLPWLLPAVVAMATYHRLAGMEPLDLPDDIEVRDPRTLVAADHVRRRTRRIVRPD